MNPINLNRFFDDFYALKDVPCRYLWGAKTADPMGDLSKITCSDCSNFIFIEFQRRGWSGIMQGSEAQRDWFLSLGLHEPNYQDILTYAKHDSGRLFVAGFAKGGTHRHIYCVIAGTTYECGSSVHGVGSRPASEFLDETEWCVEIPVIIP